MSSDRTICAVSTLQACSGGGAPDALRNRQLAGLQLNLMYSSNVLSLGLVLTG